MGDAQQLRSNTPYLQQRNVVIGRGFTTSGEDMENNQQPTSTTTQYL